MHVDAITRDQITEEFGMLLTISTLMLGVVFGLMFAVTRDEISSALSMDAERCMDKGGTRKTCTPAYDAFIFVMGSICAEGCAAVMICVMLMNLSLSLCKIRANEDVKATKFYKKHVNGIRFCYVLMVLCFVCGAYAAINVMFVKIQNVQLQIAVYDICLVWWGMVCVSIALLIWENRQVRKDCDAEPEVEMVSVH